MKVTKISNFVGFRRDQDAENLARAIDNDLRNLFMFTQGRVRFGDSASGNAGENISGEFRQFTSDSSANTETAVTHSLGSVPKGMIVMWKDKIGELYQGPDTGTAWTSTTIYVKSAGTSVEYLIFLLK